MYKTSCICGTIISLECQSVTIVSNNSIKGYSTNIKP